MRAPSAGVPLPGGKPVPSGNTLMSHAASSAGVMGFPRFGAWARAASEARTTASSTTKCRTLCIYMFHLATGIDRPGCDRVAVLAWKCGDRGNLSGLAALGDKLRSCGLHISGIVPRAALQYGGAAVPAPRNTEPGESLAVYGFLQCCLCPALAAIGGDHHF